MKRFYTAVTALVMAIAVTTAYSGASAQTRARSSSRATTTQSTRGSSNISSSSSTRQSGITSRQSGNTNRSTSTASRSTGTTTRQSGTTTRQSGTTTRQSGTTTRQSGTTTRQSGTTTRQSGTTTRQSGTTTRQSGTTTRQSGTTTRQSGTTTRQSGTTTRQSGTTTRQSGTTTRQSGSAVQGGTTSRSVQSGSATRTSRSTTRAISGANDATTSRSVQSGSATRVSGNTVRDNSNVTRHGLGNPSANNIAPTENYRDNGGNYRYTDSGFRMDDHYNVGRIPPRERTHLTYDRPGLFWGDTPHYYGYRVSYLPPRYRRATFWGIDYYIYNNIYYRLHGGIYYVCRPPFGIRVEHAIERAMLNAVRFSYYTNVYRTFNTTFANYATIAEQNRIIAQNNAIIAQQNASYALNSNRALSAYEIASRLGLVQSYAYANSDYFYQDGVFYLYQNGNYTTIIPPAGALVTSLPDDYETIVMNGTEYYLVDNTVYRTMLFNSQPYLEVLGQMYGDLYNRYSIYR